MKVPFFKPWINQNDKDSVLSVLNNRWLTNGPILKKFEKQIESFLDMKFSIGVGSATHALHLAMRSLGISPGDEVIVPTFTFVATANAVRYCGAKPIFADVDIDTFNISVSDIKNKISNKTKAIIPVHYGGQSCDMMDILKIAKKNKLFVVEDCAHALGSLYSNKKCGSFGNLSCFSFYATKVITTGEGGMVVTNNSKLNKKIKLLRSQGMSIQASEREKTGKWKYDIVDLGYNYRLDEIRSALGFSQLKRISKINKKRQSIAKKYDKLISKIPGIEIPYRKASRNHIFHLYTIKVTDKFTQTRNQLFQHLYDNGIGTSVQYFPLHLMSEFKSHKQQMKTFKNAQILKDQVISLPIFPTMTIDEINYVVKNLK